jgi:hypothetical protein
MITIKKNIGSSVQTSASTETPKKALCSNKPPLVIDRVSITIAVDEVDHRNVIRETYFSDLKKNEQPFENRGWLSTKGGRYETAMRIHAPNAQNDIAGKWSKEVFALLQCNPKNGQGGFLRLEFNPNRWGTSVQHLWQELEHVMWNPGNFLDFMMKAKVTRLDVAIDIDGIQPDDYVWDTSKAIYRSHILKRARLETLYLGSKNAARAKGQVRIYDKAAQMKIPNSKLTRVERVVKSGVLRVADLPKLPNVLDGIECYDVVHALANSGLVPPEYCQFFHDACASRGLRGALKNIKDDKRRKQIRAVIKSSTPTFWDPDLAWSGWGKAVSKVFPWIE